MNLALFELMQFVLDVFTQFIVFAFHDIVESNEESLLSPLAYFATGSFAVRFETRERVLARGETQIAMRFFSPAHPFFD